MGYGHDAIPQGIVGDAHVAWRSLSPIVVVLTHSLVVGSFISGIRYLTSGRDVPNVDQVVGCLYIASWKVPGLARTNELREQLKDLPHVQIARLVVLLYVNQADHNASILPVLTSPEGQTRFLITERIALPKPDEMSKFHPETSCVQVPLLLPQRVSISIRC